MSNTLAATKTRKAEQSERTRTALLRVARKMFAERGFAETSLQDVAERAGVTTGAVYHQYRDKKALFHAVLETLQVENFERARESSREKVGHALRQSWQRLATAGEMVLDSFMDPTFCQIVMIDGPAVLGWEKWHSIRGDHFLKYLRETMEQQMKLGHVQQEPVEPLVHLLFGALTEAGMLIAHAEDKRAMRAQVGNAALRMFNRLRVS